MKKSDIKVGETYAYAASNWDYDNYNAKKVEVLGVGLTRRQRITGTYGSYRIVSDGVLVKMERPSGGGNFEEILVTSRQIRADWGSYSERKAANQARKKEAAEARKSASIRHFENLLKIDRALRRTDPSITLAKRRIYHDEIEDAKAAGWTPTTTMVGSVPYGQIETPLSHNSIHGGSIDMQDALRLAEAVL